MICVSQEQFERPLKEITQMKTNIIKGMIDEKTLKI